MPAVALVLVALAAVVFPLLLYLAVRAEHDDRVEMDRADAERAARRDTADEE